MLLKVAIKCYCVKNKGGIIYEKIVSRGACLLLALCLSLNAVEYQKSNENKEAIEKSKLIHEKTKASYPFLMPDKTNFNGRLNGIQAMPENFFVDSNGNIVGDTYSGAKSVKEWKQVIEKELKKIKNK